MQKTPLWWRDVPVADKSTGTASQKTWDAIIIGGGYTGLSAARELALAGHEVLVITGDPQREGASTRNGGFFGVNLKWNALELEQKFGETAARNLLIATRAADQFSRQLIDSMANDCHFQANGRLRLQWGDVDFEPLEAPLRHANALLPEALHIPYTLLDRARLAQETSAQAYGGAILIGDHGTLNPALYHAGLQQLALDAGVKILSHRRVVELDTQQGNVVHTDRNEQFQTPTVLLATGGHMANTRGMRWYRRRIIRVPSFIVATKPLAPELIAELLPITASMPQGRGMTDSRARQCYYRLDDRGERLVFGGRAALIDVPTGFATAQLRSLIASIFPALADVELTHSWRGYTGFSFEYLPHIGFRPSKLPPQRGLKAGIGVAYGYCGNGVAMAPYLGNALARLSLGDEPSPFAHTPLARRWYYPGWQWFMPIADVLFRAKDLTD